MAKENVSLGFRQKKIDETRNYLLYEIKQNDLISEKHKKVCRNLNCLEYSILFISAGIGCLSISALASLAVIPVDIKSSAVELKMCAITAGTKKLNSFIKKKMKKHNKILLLGKAKLDTTEVWISKTLIDSYINHDGFVSVNVLREYNEIKKEIKNPRNAVEYTT